MHCGLRDMISSVSSTGCPVWHFNFAELSVMKAAARVAVDCGVPLIMGTSEGEREYVGVHEAVALIASYRARGIPLYLNADHSKSFAKAKEAIDAGYDAVIFDGSAMPLDENIRETRRVVEYARLVNPRIIVEGEVGYIGVASKLLDAVPDGVQMASVEDSMRFVRETGVDLFAPAVGNIHGMLKSGKEPALDIGLVKRIKDAVRVPLVLHGASGNTDVDIRRAVAAGIGVIHINTEIRVAWRKALDASCTLSPDEVAPYKLLMGPEEAAYAAMRGKISIWKK